MSKYLLKIIVAILTFFVGVGLFDLFQIYVKPLSQIEFLNEKVTVFENNAQQITVCQLLDNPYEYDGKVVTFEATAYSSFYSGETILYPTSCKIYRRNYLYPSLNLSDYIGNNSNLKILLSDDYNELEVDVSIIGVVKKIFNENDEVQYTVSPIEIKLISPFRNFSPKGAA